MHPLAGGVHEQSCGGYADGYYRAPSGSCWRAEIEELRIAADVLELSAMRVETSESGREEWRAGRVTIWSSRVALACWTGEAGRRRVQDRW